MSIFDTIGDAASSGLKSLGSNVQDYIKTNVTQAFVKVGTPPSGNLTAQQIAQGQTGQAAQAAIPASTQAQNAIQNAGAMLKNPSVILPLLAGAVLLFVVMKKR